MSNYLSCRTQATKIFEAVSSTSCITSGVPQGSVLGPYLYCIVAATLAPVHELTQMIKYVDDVTLCIPISCEPDSKRVMEEHKNVIKWSISNKLILNESKSKTMFVKKNTLCGPKLLEGVELVDVLRILGVFLRSNLSWDSHIDHLLQTANRRLYALRLLKPLTSADDLKLIYFSLIRSLFDYASPVFVHLPLCLDLKIEKFQNRVHKLICSLPKDFRATNCPCQSFPTVKERRQTSAMKLFRNAAQNTNHILHDIMPSLSQRTGRFIQPTAASSRHRNSFVPYTCALLQNTFIQ